MSTTTKERRIVTALASLVLSLFTLSGLPSTTMATTGSPVGDIMNTPGTINVYEHADPGGTLGYGNDNEVSAEGGVLGGVPFALYKVEDVDPINGNAGQDVVGKITDPAKPVGPALDSQNSPTRVAIDGRKYTLREIDEKATADRAGPAQFTDVYPGFHIIIGSKASLPPDSVIVAKAAPFFITLPIKDAKGAWSYTANVCLKNAVSPRPEGSAEVKNAVDGVITRTMKQALPTFDDTNKLTRFRFEGDLSGAGDTKDTLASVKVTVSGEDKAGNFNKELTDPDDKHLVITAKNSGDFPSGGEIVTTYITKASGNDQFHNSVLNFISDVEVGHALAFVDLDKIIVEKLDTTDKTLYLSDVEFKVCISEDGMGETRDCPAVGTITTEESLGTGSLDKLKIQKYVLFETTAPAGYIFNPDTPYKADLTTTTYNAVTLTVENTKTNMPTLSLMGTDGQLLMTTGGVALVLLTGGVFLVVRRKRSEK